MMMRLLVACSLVGLVMSDIECPLTADEKADLEKARYKGADFGVDMIKGEFVQMWTSKIADTDKPFCFNSHVRYNKDSKLEYVTSVRNMDTGKTEEESLTLEKHKDNVYKVKSADGKEHSLLYVIYTSGNVLGLFQCLINPPSEHNTIMHNIAAFLSKHQTEMVDTKTLPLAKLMVVLVRTSGLDATTLKLLPVAEKTFNEAKTVAESHVKLFGTVQPSTAACKVYPDTV